MERIVLPRYKSSRLASKKNEFIISTSLSVSRNVEALIFPEYLDVQQKILLDEKLMSLFLDYDPDLVICKLENIKEIHRLNMLADRIITPSFLEKGSLCLYKKNASWIVLLNDLDHISIFSMEFGLGLKEMYKNIRSVLNSLDTDIHYAYHPEFGYLTSSINRAGNGIDMSVLLNIIGIDYQNSLNILMNTCLETGYVLEKFSENDRSGLFYLKNDHSFGISEIDHINHMSALVEKIQLLEKEARKKLLSTQDNIESFVGQIHDFFDKDTLSYNDAIILITLVDLLSPVTYKILDPLLWEEQIFRLDDNSSLFNNLNSQNEKDKFRYHTLKQLFKKIVKYM